MSAPAAGPARARTGALTDGVHPAWARLAAGWPVECGVAWTMAEAGRVSDRQFVTVVTDGARPLAAATWLLLTGREERTGYSAPDLLRAAELPLDATVAAALLPCAGLVLPGTHQPAVLWDRELTGGELTAALELLVTAVAEEAARRGARSVALTAVPATSAWSPLRTLLARHGYVRAAQPPVAELELPAGGLDGYLAALPRHRRKNVRRELAAFAGAVDRVAVHDADRLLADDVVTLVHDRYRRYGHRTPAESVRARMAHAQRLPGLTVLAAYRCGELHGFVAFAVDRPLGRTVPRFGGCRPDSFFGYFNLTFYEPVRHCHAEGLRSLGLGDGSYAAKQARGATLHARDAFVRALDPAVAPLLRPVSPAAPPPAGGPAQVG